MRAQSSVLSILLVLISFSVTSCDSGNPFETSTKLNDTVTIGVKDIFFHKDPDFTLQVDSILNDSRCPIGVQCFWEGNAEVRFKFNSNRLETIFFKLNTANSFRQDTIIQGVYFKLIELVPHPNIYSKYRYQSYFTKIYYSTLNQ